MPSPLMAERNKGQIPISMGTALAVEGALGIYPERPEDPPPIERYDALWVNLRTLYRNLQACFPVEVQRSWRPMDLAAGLWEDVAGLHVALKKDHPKLEVVVYLSAYENLAKRFPAATLKQPKTPPQIASQELEEATYAVYRKSLPPDIPFAPVKCFLPEVPQKTLLMTHVTLDLLARYHFKALDLLESNTGVIKKPAQWNTKLGVKDQADLLPFNSFTLQIFGDRSVLFQPQPTKLRQAVLSLAEARHWSSITTLDRIRENLRQFAPKELRDTLAPFTVSVPV